MSHRPENLTILHGGWVELGGEPRIRLLRLVYPLRVQRCATPRGWPPLNSRDRGSHPCATQLRTLSCDMAFDQALSAPNVRLGWSYRLHLLELFSQTGDLMLQSHQGRILWGRPSPIFLRVARHGLYLHGLLQSVLQIVNLLMGEGVCVKGSRALMNQSL